jgi:uncharacterized protein YbaA (DUF1428 family)
VEPAAAAAGGKLRPKEIPMPRYVDGFVLPVPKKNIPAYKRMSQRASRVWREHGALEYRECAGDDLSSMFGQSFEKVMRCRPGETVVFAWIVYRSRKHRDAVNAKVMADPRLAAMTTGKAMPFDVKRMCFGGFQVIVDA